MFILAETDECDSIDRLAANRVAEASNQEALINSLQNAVTELHRTTDSQKHTIEETEKQLHILQLIKSDHDNMVGLGRQSYLQICVNVLECKRNVSVVEMLVILLVIDGYLSLTSSNSNTIML